MAIFNFLTKAFSAAAISLLITELYLAFCGYSFSWMQPAPDYLDQNALELWHRTGWGASGGVLSSEEDPSVKITVWEDGMRECRRNKDKKSPVNVAFVGCSFTFGEGLKTEDTMVYKLNEKYPKVTFDNYGVYGWGPVQIYARIEYLLKYSGKKYDLIVYPMIHDHKFRNYSRKALGNLSKNGKYIPYPFCNDLSGSCQIHYVNDQKWPFEDRLLTADILKRAYFAYWTAEEMRSRGRENMKSVYGSYVWLINKMHDLCQENGTDFLLCSVNYGSNFEIGGMYKHEMINIDTPDSSKPEYHIAGNTNYHPNGRCNAFWAEEFSKWFDQKGYAEK